MKEGVVLSKDFETSVTVIVPAFNEERNIEDCVESLIKTKFPQKEIIIVDDCSTDRTAQIVSNYPVKLIRREKRGGVSAARNTGIGNAKTKIIAFTDADCMVPQDWLTKLVNTLIRTTTDDPKVAGVGGNFYAPINASRLSRCFAYLTWSPDSPSNPLFPRREQHVVACNAAFWKDKLIELGCFDEAVITGGSDTALCVHLYQCGYKVHYDPDIFVWHKKQTTLWRYFLRIFRNGVSLGYRIRKGKKKPKLSLRSITFFLAPAFLCVMIISTFIWRPMLILLTMLILAYIARLLQLGYVLASRYPTPTSKSTITKIGLAIIVAFIIGFAALSQSLGLIYGVIMPRTKTPFK